MMASQQSPVPELMPVEDCKGLNPEQLRRKLRKSEWRVSTTSGLCQGHEQCNICMVDASHAEEFAEYCKQNSSALPVLFRSAKGQFSAPPLAEDSCIVYVCCDVTLQFDISLSIVQTVASLKDFTLVFLTQDFCILYSVSALPRSSDLSSYQVCERGSRTCVYSLEGYPCERYVTFYIGCSFGAELMLSKADVPLRHVEQGLNVAMYRTYTNTNQVGPFKTVLVVSLRHIPADRISDVVHITRRLTRSHGMPVHIGDPAYLGIDRGLKPDYGAQAAHKAGDVPMFWACGVTALTTMEQAGLDLSMTHSPGQMFVCDSKVEFESDIDPSHTIEVLKFSSQRFPDTYALLSPEAHQRVTKIEEIVAVDPGNRGVQHLVVKGDLLNAALAISLKCKTVAITTGFPCCPESPHSETDGPLGTWVLVRALLAAGTKRLVWLVDQNAITEYEQLKDYICRTDPFLRDNEHFHMQVFNTEQSEAEMMAEVEQFDHLIAVERSAPNAQGQYCRMTGKPLCKEVDPIDKWFQLALKSDKTVVTCVGDGGNEVGMAKVLDQVVRHIPHGDKIASVVSCDYLISAGVSNWGAYALATSLFALRSCSDHSYNQRIGLGEHTPPDPKLFLPALDSERAALAAANELGFRDGAKPEQLLSVDGMFFDDQHTKLINALRCVVGQ